MQLYMYVHVTCRFVCYWAGKRPQFLHNWWGTCSPQTQRYGVWSTAAAWWPARSTPASVVPAPVPQHNLWFISETHFILHFILVQFKESQLSVLCNNLFFLVWTSRERKKWRLMTEGLSIAAIIEVITGTNLFNGCSAKWNVNQTKTMMYCSWIHIKM